MEKLLLLQVHWHDDRYHGAGEWPPSPARLFQALVAGSAVGATLPTNLQPALHWLESLQNPPDIYAPHARTGQAFTTFVPNNDLDAKGGDPSQVANLRVGKSIRPRFIAAGEPISYGWQFDVNSETERHAATICAMAENLYQLGRGVDMAWAVGSVLEADAAEVMLHQHGGRRFAAQISTGGLALDAPQPGSLASLLTRYQAHCTRFTRVRDGKKVKVYFAQPPKPHFRQASYNIPNRTRLFDLRTNADDTPLRAWPQAKVNELTTKARDAAFQRLTTALPLQATAIERVLLGRNAGEADKAQRIRLIPLASIGHSMTERSIRRLLVEIPANCPIPPADIEWAFSGATIDAGLDESTGELSETILMPAEDLGMLRHYGIETGDNHRTWRSITPVVVPPHRHAREKGSGGPKTGSERGYEEASTRQAVAQALRHTGVNTIPVDIRVQREPFSARGLRADAFVPGTRFTAERLWHVEIRLSEPIEGPLIVGDGRYAGLGVMAPVDQPIDVLAYGIRSGLATTATPEELTRALRRAVMARVQHQIGMHTPLAEFFTGHATDGAPLRAGDHRHLAFVFDAIEQRLLITPPHVLEQRASYAHEREHLGLLDTAMLDFHQLRAGKAGLLELTPIEIDIVHDPLFARATEWQSLTPYRPTRHAKHLTPAQALSANLAQELHKQGLPTADIEVTSVEEGPRGGLCGHARLRFPVAQAGPILIGQSRHFGGGLFQAARHKSGQS